MEENNKDNNVNNEEQMNSMFDSTEENSLFSADAALENEVKSDEMPEEIEEALQSNSTVQDTNESAVEEADITADETMQDSLDESQINIEENVQKTNDVIEQSEETIKPQQTSIAYEDNTVFSSDDSLVTVRPVRFQNFDESVVNLSIKKNLDIMQDIPMHITVELGRTKSTIKDIINMNVGSIVELDKIAGEQVEIYANEKLIARGEVIVIEDKFGVRVVNTNIPKEIF